MGHYELEPIRLRHQAQGALARDTKSPQHRYTAAGVIARNLG